ncbi:hypothetical protein cypCar_00035605 [Cyprinus carpio]|nr:hypothetical protein cypCar_00035605 [Cyprinus carpio]
MDQENSRVANTLREQKCFTVKLHLIHSSTDSRNREDDLRIVLLGNGVGEEFNRKHHLRKRSLYQTFLETL